MNNNDEIISQSAKSMPDRMAVDSISQRGHAVGGGVSVTGL